MTYLAIVIWMGGASALCGRVGFLTAVSWPLYLGRYLAKISMRDYLSAKSE